MIFFSPVPLEFAPVVRAAVRTAAVRHDDAPTPAPRSILERCIDVWTAPYSSGVASF